MLIALLLGLLIGGLGVRWFSTRERLDVPVPVEAPAEKPAPREVREVALPEPERVVADGAREAPEQEPDALITAALRRHAEAGMRKGWKTLRADELSAAELAEGMQSFEKLVLESPLDIGRSLAAHRTKLEEALEDAKTGGVFALLEKLDHGAFGPLPELVGDLEQFDPLFVRIAPEGVQSGLLDRAHPDKTVEDGVTLSWPAGVFRVGNLMREKDPFPRDVTLAGAGMNATMLVLSGTMMTSGQLRNFAIRDCTVHTNNNYLFDLRSKPAAVRLDRARFVGFDMGAGSSCLFGTHQLALWARNCRFEGGYGRSPQHGILFDVRTDGMVARFDSCTFSLLSLTVQHIRPGATVLFASCAFDEILDDPLRDAGDRRGILFDNCSLLRHEGGWQTIPKLDLNALFPSWKERME